MTDSCFCKALSIALATVLATASFQAPVPYRGVEIDGLETAEVCFDKALPTPLATVPDNSQHEAQADESSAPKRRFCSLPLHLSLCVRDRYFKLLRAAGLESEIMHTQEDPK